MRSTSSSELPFSMTSTDLCGTGLHVILPLDEALRSEISPVVGLSACVDFFLSMDFIRFIVDPSWSPVGYFVAPPLGGATSPHPGWTSRGYWRYWISTLDFFYVIYRVMFDYWLVIHHARMSTLDVSPCTVIWLMSGTIFASIGELGLSRVLWDWLFDNGTTVCTAC